MGVQRQSKHELAGAIQARYLKAGRVEKGQILDEFVAATGYHRRHAVRLLRHGRFPDPKLAAVQGPAPAGAGGRGQEAAEPWEPWAWPAPWAATGVLVRGGGGVADGGGSEWLALRQAPGSLLSRTGARPGG